MTRYFVVALMLAVLLSAAGYSQEVQPTSLTIEAVPGYTSPEHDIVFTNTGASELALTITVSGPFSLPLNRCGRGVKPGTHCNVYVTYTPEAIETDTGALTFAFGNQNVSVALTGDGVSAIPTALTIDAHHANVSAKITAGAKGEGYKIPDHDWVYVVCEGSGDIQQASGYTQNGKAHFQIGFGTLDCGWFSCTGYYYNNSIPQEFATSQYNFRTYWWGSACGRRGGEPIE